jgi:hypothetical protein
MTLTLHLCRLLPADPLKRAEGRFAIEFYSSKIVPNLYAILKNPDQKESIVQDLNVAYQRVSEWTRASGERKGNSGCGH